MRGIFVPDGQDCVSSNNVVLRGRHRNLASRRVERQVAVARKPEHEQFDLRNRCPKTVYDQGHLGSCTANAIAGAIEFDQIKQGQQQATPSRLFIYYNERAMEHSIQFDSGAQLRDGIKSVAKLGACPETIWPYDDTPPETEDSPCG